MYQSKKRLSILMMFVLMLALVFTINTDVYAARKKGKLNYYKKTVSVGKSFKLKVKGAKVKKWYSRNKTIARVTKYGNVYGKSAGTVKICARLKNGKLVYCTVTVKDSTAKVSNSTKLSSDYLTSTQANVALNMLGAVETGGQIYGNRDYSNFTNPYAASPGEHSSTAGAYQEFGENLRQLLLRIQSEYPSVFAKYDTANIASDIKKAWSSSNPYKVYAGSAKAKAIVNIISTTQGKAVQDARALDLFDSYLSHIKSLGVTNVQAALFMAECEHLGGSSAVERIVKRATNKNSIDSLWDSLIKDQKDTSSSYQIGDKIYQTRHQKCRTWLKQYISSSATLR